MPDTPTNQDLIRNLGQTHQERPIIKMAPDSIVYIDGLPYLLNDFVGKSGTVFNFNDFVTQAAGAADVNTWVPTATVNISLPNDLRYLAQAPAGQRIIRTMSEIKIFTKGYYLTDDGESVYHRVFWGVVGSVVYSDNKKTLEIALSCKGIMHIFELMQLNNAPSVVTAQHFGSEVTPFIDKCSEHNPFEIILHSFTAPLDQSVIDQETLAENNAWVPKDMFERVYVKRWNRYLLDMRKAVRFHGLRVKDGPKDGSASVTQAPVTIAPDPEATKAGESTASRVGAKKNLVDEVGRALGIDEDLVRKFLPMFKIGTLNLLQSTVVSRLARVDEMVKLMGFEGYQDLDGSIVIKPPLYNLDVQKTKAPRHRNPFIISLPEVLGAETETEDESQIRVTRLSVTGSLASTQIIPPEPTIQNVATYMDPGLVQQFGLRNEPVKVMPVIADNSYALFAYAAAEVTKLNKNYRTYTVTIPMRPELRLGFPVYVPHLDIYAYLENISWSYVRGGQATMTLSCTNVRQRELFGVERPVVTAGVTTKEWVYNPKANLVFTFTARPAEGQNKDSKNRISTDPVGTELTTPPDKALPAAQQQVIARAKRLANMTQTAPDQPGISWRVGEDALGFFRDAKTGGVVNKDYYDKVTQGLMPYTDDKGYNVLRPFPWGRYQTLEDALDLLTRPEARRTQKLLPFEAPEPNDSKATSGTKAPEATTTATQATQVSSDAQGPNAFLMSGLGTPSLSTTDPTKGTPQDQKLFDTLLALKDKIDDDTVCFVLKFTGGEQGMATPNLYNAEEQQGNDSQLPDGGVSLPGPGEATQPPKQSLLDKATAFVHGVTQALNGSGESELSQ